MAYLVPHPGSGGKRLFPEAKLAIGPAIDNGFYYDFDVDNPFSPEDLEAIEKEMARIVKENLNLNILSCPVMKPLSLWRRRGKATRLN